MKKIILKNNLNWKLIIDNDSKNIEMKQLVMKNL